MKKKSFFAKIKVSLLLAFLIAMSIPAYTADCPDAPPDGNGGSESNLSQSSDPNEMAGPAGKGEKRYIELGQWLDYIVYFENKSDADVPAQFVKVDAQLSQYLDWSTFELGEVVFNNQNEMGLAGKKDGIMTVDQTGASYQVKVSFSMNEATGTIQWILRSYDPSRPQYGYWPAGVNDGFLPPNDDSHRGEGHLAYRIKVRDDAPKEAIIHAAAEIVFDDNEMIPTDPSWFNTVEFANVFANFDSNGGDGEMQGQPFKAKKAETLVANTFTRVGWTFGGWNTLANGSGKDFANEAKITLTDNTTLYAIWYQSNARATVGTSYITNIETIITANPKYAIKGLPAGMKLNPDGTITGTPTKPGDYWILVTITGSDKSKETLRHHIVVLPITAQAVGTFTGVIYGKDEEGNTTSEIVGTWKMTASNVGKLTAQVLTVNSTGKLVKLAFKGTSWAALDPAKPNIYTAEMKILDKKTKLPIHTLEISVDTSLDWNTMNVEGLFTSSLLPRPSSLCSGQRNAFLDKPIKPTTTTPSLTYLSDYLGDWVARYDAVADTWTTEKGKLAKTDVPTGKYLTIKIAAGGAIKYSGKIPVLGNKPVSFSGSSTLLNEEDSALMPVFNAIKNSTIPEADLIEIKN